MAPNKKKHSVEEMKWIWKEINKLLAPCIYDVKMWLTEYSLWCLSANCTRGFGKSRRR